MTARHARALRRRPLAIWSGLALITALAIGSAVPAFAAEGCDDTTTAGTLVVTIANSSTTTVLSVDASGDVVVVGPTGCAGPYVSITAISIATDVPGDDTDETVAFSDPANAGWSDVTSIAVNLGDESDDTVVLDGTSAADTFSTSFVTSPTGIEHFELNGFEDVDTLTGGSTEDTISGGDGDDVLSGGSADDDIYGGAGADTIHGDAGDDHLDGEADGDTIYGDADDDYIHGGNDTSSDVLYGGDGDDLFDECVTPGTGADDIFGENGRDTVDYSGRSGNLTVTLDAGTDDDGESGEMDDIVSVEDVLGGSGADTLTGNASDNHLSGGGDNDTLSGGLGNDVLEGGAGADAQDGGDGSDTASYEHASTGVSVDLGTPSVGGGEESGDAFTSIENLLGSDHGDVLTGTSGQNSIWGEGGDDDLAGGGGNDVLDGEDGSDDIWAGDGNDLLLGGNGGDFLYGEANADTLRGGSGVDTMDGGSGNDSLFGEAGAENSASNWTCGTGTDKANVDREDGFTKTTVRTALTDCEKFAGSFLR